MIFKFKNEEEKEQFISKMNDIQTLVDIMEEIKKVKPQYVSEYTSNALIELTFTEDDHINDLYSMIIPASEILMKHYKEIEDITVDQAVAILRFYYSSFYCNVSIGDEFLNNIDVSVYKEDKYTLSFKHFPENTFAELTNIACGDFQGTVYPYLNKMLYNGDVVYDFPCIDNNETNIEVDSLSGFSRDIVTANTKNMSKDVLVLGLGIGYHIYRLLRKTSIKNITVVEKDANIINLFKTYVLPTLKSTSKLTIINEDPREFIKRTHQEGYDYCYVYNIISVDDLHSYFSIRQNITKNISSVLSITYYSDSMFVSRIAEILYSKVYSNLNGDLEKLNSLNTSNCETINDFIFKMFNVEITCFNDFNKLMKKSKILEVIRNLSCNAVIPDEYESESKETEPSYDDVVDDVQEYFELDSDDNDILEEMIIDKLTDNENIENEEKEEVEVNTQNITDDINIQVQKIEPFAQPSSSVSEKLFKMCIEELVGVEIDEDTDDKVLKGVAKTAVDTLVMRIATEIKRSIPAPQAPQAPQIDLKVEPVNYLPMKEFYDALRTSTNDLKTTKKEMVTQLIQMQNNMNNTLNSSIGKINKSIADATKPAPPVTPTISPFEQTILDNLTILVEAAKEAEKARIEEIEKTETEILDLKDSKKLKKDKKKKNK